MHQTSTYYVTTDCSPKHWEKQNISSAEAFKGQIYIQYDYRHTNGKLFSTVAKTLEICRQKRDEWIKRQEQRPVYILFQTDVHKTKSSRVCFGVYSSEEKAIEAATKNDLYTH